MRAETIRFSLCIRPFEGLRSRHSTPVGLADTPSPGGGMTAQYSLKQSDKLKFEQEGKYDTENDPFGENICLWQH